MTQPTTVPQTGFVMSEKLYNRLKWITTIVLPAFGTFYVSLGSLWGLPAVAQVTGTILAFTTFLGVILGISSNTYKKSDERFDGVMNVSNVVNDDESTTKTFQLDVGDNLEHLEDKKEIILKVQPK